MRLFYACITMLVCPAYASSLHSTHPGVQLWSIQRRTCLSIQRISYYNTCTCTYSLTRTITVSVCACIWNLVWELEPNINVLSLSTFCLTIDWVILYTHAWKFPCFSFLFSSFWNKESGGNNKESIHLSSCFTLIPKYIGHATRVVTLVGWFSILETIDNQFKLVVHSL